VSGLVLLNPWVRTDEGMARAQLQHYYGARLLQGSFWQKVLRGELNALEAGRGVGRSLLRVMRPSQATPAKPLPERMEEGLRRFKGPVLLILSGNDLTAQEFKDLVARSPGWQGLLQNPRVTRRDFPEANHSFSRREWRDRVAKWTMTWLMQARD
jgi:hypothetical protein